MADGYVDIPTSDVAFDVHFHPLLDVVASAQVSGVVEVHRVGGGGGGERIHQLVHHKDSARSCRFTSDGLGILTCSSDRSVARTDTSGGLTWHRLDAHDAPVNVVQPFLAGMVASGDDDGTVRVWDTRQPPATKPLTLEAHKDVVADMLVDEGRGVLLTVSGDGSLALIDLRKGRIVTRSDPGEDELLSVAMIKGGSVVVTGTQEGPVLVWDWGKWTWGDENAEEGPERFTGHPASVATILHLDTDTIVTGSEDGIVRLLTVRPNKLVGVVGEYGEEGLPIERLAWNAGKTLLAAVGHEERVRVFDTRFLHEEEEEEEGEGDVAGGSNASRGAGRAPSRTSKFVSLPPLQGVPGRDEEEEEEEDGEDSDEDMDDEEEGEDEEEEDAKPSRTTAVPKGRGGKGGGARGPRKGDTRKAGAKDGGGAGRDFFDDMD